MKVRKVVAALAIVGAALVLTGCTNDRSGVADDGWVTQVITLPDGRAVICVLYDGYDGDSVTCDWSGHDDVD